MIRIHKLTVTSTQSPGMVLALCALLFAFETATASEFTFARLRYGGDLADYWPRWQADWPEAEEHFSEGLERLTVIDVSEDDEVLTMSDDALFDHPWLYVVEVGSMRLSDGDTARLREYLLRGGFLMIDDFHGAAEWQPLAQQMARTFPDRPIVDLDAHAEPFHVLYDLSERQQIPGIRALMSGRTWEKGGRYPHWRGVLDDAGRVMVAINFNQDIGDAWEHADDGRYPAPLTTQAYRLGVNYVVYAMTH